MPSSEVTRRGREPRAEGWGEVLAMRGTLRVSKRRIRTGTSSRAPCESQRETSSGLESLAQGA